MDDELPCGADDLSGSLRLTPIGPGEHEARCLSGRSGRIYGGQLLAQGFLAAVTDPRPVGPDFSYSLHAHFLNAGTPQQPIRLRTVSLRRSTRFATTRVDIGQAAVQLATLTVSAHRDEKGASHAPLAPAVLTSPDTALPARGGPIPALDAPIRQPFDLRHAALKSVIGSDGRPQVGLWLRLRRAPRGPVEQVAALIWASDFALTRVADVEHEHRPGTRQAASLDHAMWIHQAVDLSQWHLYVLSSPVYRGGLALSAGRIYGAGGELVASVTQESLLRRVVS